MMARCKTRSVRAAIAVMGTVGAIAIGCGGRSVTDATADAVFDAEIDTGIDAVTDAVTDAVADAAADTAADAATDTGADTAVDARPCVPEEIRKLDLLLEVDNSGSMRENQANIMQQFGLMINTLTNPPCRSRSNPSAPLHPCDPMNPDDVQAYPPVRDLHVGVISTDLGTPGSTVPGCANSDQGDDGLLNPIRYGQAMAEHLPWAPRRGEAAPPGFRPAECNDDSARERYPSFITFTSGVTDPRQFETDFKCNAGLYINGCGLEQQLEAIWRALIWHDARDRAGNTSPNRGFVRDDALLAIVVLSDEEDGSVRDCRYARGEPCTSAIDVINPGSMAWASSNLNLRFYLYQPCSEQDPTWPLDRYYDPSSPNRGFLSLKPGHPERVIFAAITGVPLDIPMTGDGMNRRIDWDQLLGRPGPRGPNDFCGRDSSTAYTAMSREGPVSMRQANQDPNCSDRVVPACRREGSAYNPSRPPCTTTEQYFAWPARRIVEIARRFDETPLCGGQPCRNGLVTSICGSNYAAAMRQIIEKIASRLGGRC